MIYIINLKKDTERRKFMENQINQRKDKDRFIFFEGYDAKKEGTIKTDIELKKYFPKKWNKGLYKNADKLLGKKGCMLSHIRIIKEAVDKNINQVIILEDDCVIEGDFLPPDNLEDDDFLFYFGAGLREKIRKGKINLTPKNYITYELERSERFNKIEDYIMMGTYAYGINNCGEFYKRLTRYAPIAIDMLYNRYFQSKPIYVKNIIKTPELFPSNIEDYSTKFIFKELLIKDIIRNYTIAILSYDRMKIFEKKTYKLLKKYNLLSKAILFLSTEKDIAEYSKFNIPMVLSPKGYCETCNFISEYYPLGKKIIIIGDDITRFNIYNCGENINNCGKNTEVKDLNSLFNTLFKILDEKNISLGGFYPTSNPLALRGIKNLLTTDLRFIHDACCGMINRGIKLDSSILKCDFQRTILYYERDGGIVRLNNYSFDTRFNKGKGGNTNEKNNEEHYSKLFEEKYSQYIQRKITHKNGTSSFILRKNGIKKIF